MSRRRRREQPVATLPVAFSDAYDYGPGERFSSSTEGAPVSLVQSVRRPLWRRLVEAEHADTSWSDFREARVFRSVQRRPVLLKGIGSSRVVRFPSYRGVTRLQAPFSGRVAGLNRLRLSRSTRVCVRRVQRRQVLFALRRAGRGNHGSYKRTLNSSWSCR